MVLLICCGSAESWLSGFSENGKFLWPTAFLSRSRASTNKSNLRAETASTVNLKVPIARPPRLIIAGAPAAGKGTQCEIIKAAFGVVHLSTGDILRQAVRDSTPLGLQVKDYMDNGRLVPDELITNLVCERLEQEDCITRGWLLDGFPRTAFQAEALLVHCKARSEVSQRSGLLSGSSKFDPDCFVLLDVPEEILVHRVEGRRIDPLTNAVYHLTFKPPPNDPEVLSRLIHRSDDTREKIVTRYQDFKRNIDAIKSKFATNIIKTFDGTVPQAELSESILQCIRDSLKS